MATVLCLRFAPVLLLAVSSTEQRRLPSTGRVLTVTIAVIGMLLVSLVGGAGGRAPNPALGILAALGSGPRTHCLPTSQRRCPSGSTR
ncbi:drug/metabolite transporter (DMT)-like permease [Hamadaea flava]|uniref:Uncharacterized protein n=1 Tax=Hamadaea flava TaxID=1742688 RepID=A0ABV8LLA4_9ACTN|nr:drug/metabolite transporter (DMT)-like permease [Hamadaea flava]